MAAMTSLASQLQALKSFVQSDAAAEQTTRRPYTKPSIIFDPKEAADIDLKTILSLALSGLEVLVDIDVRFRGYMDSLFSERSLDINRELMGIEENNKINDSITSYLRLLSGHLEQPSALKTLEYLIRRYKVHVYNMEELILCALPYHETHAFVRIVQLLDLGNGKWGFLNGVKTSGAPPPRNVIVQQCTRDMGVLEALCIYASPTKKCHPSMQVVRFCTAVVVEMLGMLPTIDSDTVRRILPFIFSGLEASTKGGRDHKAGVLMLIGLLASRAALAPKLIKTLVESIARVSQQEAKESADLLRMLIIAIISLLQSQPIPMFPKKALKSLMEIRDFSAVLLGLSNEFNIKKFLSIYLESLTYYSSSDDSCRLALTSAIETLPIKDFVATVVIKVLNSLSKRMDQSKLSEAGFWEKQLLVTIGEKYPSELRKSFHKFLEDLKLKPKKEDSMYESLRVMLDGSLDFSLVNSDPMIWFSLEHPKAEVRRATLSSLATSGVLKPKAFGSQLVTMQETLLQRLHDEDLGVVQVALSLKDLSAIVDPPHLIDAFRAIIVRCLDVSKTSASFVSTGSYDVAISCLECAILNVKAHLDYSRELAALIFPLIIVFPKTWKLNVKALELAKELHWPLYDKIFGSYDLISVVKDKMPDPNLLTSTNMKTVGALTEAFLTHPEEYMPWLIDCCNAFAPSKTLLFLILLHSLTVRKEDPGSSSALFQVCFPVLKSEWTEVESTGSFLLEGEKLNIEKLDRDYSKFAGELLDSHSKALNANLLICIFWRLLKAFISMAPPNDPAVNEEWSRALDNLFAFFATSQLRNILKDQFHSLVKCSPTLYGFLLNFFTGEGFSVAVQVESLLTLETICASEDKSISSSHLQLLLDFPSVLVPLSSDNQDIRIAAMKCIEGLHTLWCRIEVSTGKNGSGSLLPHKMWSPSFGDLLGLLVQQKRLILSDQKFLSSYLTAVLDSSHHDILVPQSANQRFDQHNKEAIFLFILGSALKFSAFGKFMILSLLGGMGNAIVHVEGVKTLLSELLERRTNYHLRHDKSFKELSNTEIETLCLLLESCVAPSASMAKDTPLHHILTALQVNGLASDDPAVVRPCVTILQKLDSSLYSCLGTEMQDQLFQELVFLFRSDNGALHNASKEALVRINVTSSTVRKMLDFIILPNRCLRGLSSSKKKKKSVTVQSSYLHHDMFNEEKSRISFLGSLIDVLLFKKDIENRASLTGPLFELLRKILADEMLIGLVDHGDGQNDSLSTISETSVSTLCYIQQTIFLILEDISALLLSDTVDKDDILNKFDIKLLVEFARTTTDAKTRNHVLSLLSSISKVIPENVLDYIIDIFSVIGESAVTQSDSYSQSVLEDLISTIVPFWLSSAKNEQDLLQIFVNVLPKIPVNRRLTIIVYLLRTLGETSSLASLFFLLIHSLVSRTSKSWSDETLHSSASFVLAVHKEWEFEFAVQVCTQYSCLMWLRSLVLLLEQIQVGKQFQQQMSEMLIAMHFVQHKLQDTELVFKLESMDDSDYIDVQRTLGALMEQIVFHLQLLEVQSKLSTVPVGIKNELKDCMHRILKTITMQMVPTSYFRSITLLLGHADRNVRKKALQFLCETVNNLDVITRKGKKKKSKLSQNSSCSWIRLEESPSKSFVQMCSKIVQLVDSVDDIDTPIKLAAVSALEVLATKFPSNNLIFTSCLTSTTKQINSQNLALSSSCLRTVGALIQGLGPKALSDLPQIMEQLLRRARGGSNLTNFQLKDDRGVNGSLVLKGSLLLSILVTLEAVIEKLGSFLSPYLGDIIELMVMHPAYVSGSDHKMKVKADNVRRLITEKIPVRLTLAPLLKLYSKTVKSGELSVSISFEMLSNIICAMDRSSIGSYYMKIFEQCLLALDLRREHPVSVKNVDVVERSVVHAMILLTTKLTETMFKPLFIRSLEWAESKLEVGGSTDCTDMKRTISFYIFINKLTEQHRSLFVPYFKYLLEGCTYYLMDDEDVQSVGLVQKKKKAKTGAETHQQREKRKMVSPTQWHLRALIISSLHKCFIYDSGSLKFLDSSNFQVLLKPIVSQLVTEPPTSIEDVPGVPSVTEVDDSLVACLGQMAVTAGSDLLWKPLNHEVLMQTRNEKIRPRILGLRIVKYFVEHLKEEYLVLLPETIPFLGELLEDTELPVKSLAQEILKEMETLSGESLQQYL